MANNARPTAAIITECRETTERQPRFHCPTIRGMTQRSAPRSSQTDYGTEALLAVRARFFVTYRLVNRFLQFAAADGGAHMGLWRVAVVAFAAIDIIEWSILRDQDRFALKSRLALDSFDVA